MSTLHVSRRSFLKVSMLTGGGFMLGFQTLGKAADNLLAEDAVFAPNGFLKIDAKGIITLMAPNPEVGQGVKTSLPMLVAEELEVDWQQVKVQQAPLDSKNFERQVAGGSGSIRSSWEPFRKAGAAARQMLVEAAAKTWKVNADVCYAEKGYVIHRPDGKKLSYGALASTASEIGVPAEIKLKDPKDYKIIGQRIGNVDTSNIVTGKPLFGIDTRREGMFYVMVARPTFGKKLKSFDDTEARKITGVKNVVRVENKVAVLATSTWAAKKGRDALKLEWEDEVALESTAGHQEAMKRLVQQPHEKPKRNDGDAGAALTHASKILESTFEAPFLPHASLEPMNFFADVRDGKAELFGPTQTPARTRTDVAKALNIPEENVTVGMSRQGGGFGRRLQADYSLEAALISAAAKAPVQVIWTREDDMQGGFYRPTGVYRYRAAIDKNNNVDAWYLIAAAVNQANASRENSFPAGAVPNFRVDSHNLESKITIGPWRAPNHNFIAFAEETFLDEIAYELKKDPVALRLELLDRAKANTFGAKNYDVDRYKNVINLAAQMGNWGKVKQGANGIYKGFGAHFSFGTYVAQIADVSVANGKVRVHKIYCAVDCGRVINPSGAENQIEGGIVDGIGHALFGELTFEKGVAQQKNFNTYKLIRMPDAPAEIDVQFVQNDLAPQGLGEPCLPPVVPAITNAIHAATGQRVRRLPVSLMNFS